MDAIEIYVMCGMFTWSIYVYYFYNTCIELIEKGVLKAP
jgi:hypothetical protein